MRISRAIQGFLLLFFLGIHSSLAGQNSPEFLKRSTYVRHADAALEMKSMLFAFQLQHEQELNQLLEDQHNPNSPLYHQWITPEEFGKRFGVSEEKYQRVVAWLQQNGFSIAHQYPNHLSIYFDGTAAQVESAFQVRMGIYEQNGKQYYGNDRVAQVPLEFQDVTLDVLNIDNFPKEEPVYKSGSTIWMGASDMAIAYDLNPLFSRGINGAGQSVAIVARSDFNLSDVRLFRSTFGLAANDPQKVFVTTDPGDRGGSDEEEVLLDTEWSGAMAANATIKVVIAPTTDITASIDYIVNSLSSAHVMSISFGYSEQQQSASARTHVITDFSQAATQGQTVFVSSGDNGAQQPTGSGTYSDGQDINYLCASPYVVCVGGTNINSNFDSNGNFISYAGETAWGGNLSYCQNLSNNQCGSGGGKSQFISKPSYQFGPGVPNDGARDVPDVAAIAWSPYTWSIQGGNLGFAGGTSLATPLWAGFFALVNQSAGGNGIGWANPRIYEMGRNQISSGGPAVFHDITSGNNSTATVNGFTAGVGYDQVTGWGSFDGDMFVRNFSGSGGGGGSRVPLTSGVTANGTMAANSSSSSCTLSPTYYTIDVPSGTLQLIVSLSGNQDVDLYLRLGQQVIQSGNTFTADFSSTTTLSSEKIYVGPSSTPPLAAGTYYIGVANCPNGQASYTLTATVVTSSSPAKIEEMLIDDGSVDTGLLGDGLLVVNRLTPLRYPSKLVAIRVYVTTYQLQPDPVGKQITLVAFSDPSSSGRPPGSPARLVNLPVTINGEFGYIDFPLTTQPTINSGDWYVGFQYPNPGNGVLAGGDTNGPQHQRSFFSTDSGTTFLGPLTLGGNPANMMIRGVTENDAVVSPTAPILDSFTASFLPDGSVNLTVAGRDSAGNVKTLTETRLDSNSQVLGGGTFDISSSAGGRTSFNFTLNITGNLIANTRQVQAKLTDANGVDSNTMTAMVSGGGTSQSIAAGGAGVNATSGTGSTVQAGYATLTVNSGATPYGTAVFSITQNGIVVSEAGVPASPPTTSARIFIDYRSSVAAKSDAVPAGVININTGFAAVNRGTDTATITYRLRDYLGNLLTTGHGTIALNNHVALFINQLNQIAPDFLLPSNFSTSTGFATLEIASDQPLSIVALRLTTNQRGETLLTSTPLADLTKPLLSAQTFLAQLVDGGGYKTVCFLLNTSSVVETGTLRIYDDYGSPLAVHQVGDPNGASSAFTYTIQPGGFNTLFTDGAPATVHAGSVQLTPDAGKYTPVGAGVFSLTQGGVLVTESGVPTASPTTHARIYVDKSGGHDTGLAIAAPSGSSLSAALTAYLTDGSTFQGSGSLSLPGNGHTAGFAGQFISGLASGFTGVLDISSSVPFVAVTLRALTNARGEFLMTTFPIADFNQAAPSPIVFPQIADGGGYRTQFIQLEASSGGNTTLNFFGDNGSPLSLTKRGDPISMMASSGPDTGRVVSSGETNLMRR
jgi:hypothetical protein